MNKESFLVYKSFYEPLKGLSDDDFGKIFRSVFEYQIEGKTPKISPLLMMAFSFIKDALDRDNLKYESIVERNKNNGKSGGRPKKKPKKPTGLSGNPKNPNNPVGDDTDTDTDTVNDNGTVNENKNDNEENKNDFLSKIISAFQVSYFEIFQIEYRILSKGKERAAASKLLQEFKKIHPDAKSEEVLAGLGEYFLKCCEVPDDWFQKNMSLPIIVSKFNEINNLIKNGKSKKIRSVASRSAEIDAIVNAVYDAKELQ